MKAVVALLAALCLVSATTYKGVDVSYYSGVVSQSAFTCMKAANYEFVVIEAWVERHSCSTFTQTYQNAIAAGIPQVDAYAFICNSCMGGSGNVESIVSGLKSVLPSGFNGRIWLDIEYASGIWSSNGASNMAFAQSVANALTKAGYTLGIYTNYNNWQQIMMGQKTNPFSNLPLWYPRYDNNPNPTVGITNFGGWNGCTIKQYNENIKVCGINTDVNVATTLYPNNKNGTPTPTPNNNNNNHESNNESKNNESNQESSAKQSSSQKASSSPASQQNSESSAKSSAQATHPSTPSSQASSQASGQASSQHSTVQASQNSTPSTKSTKSSSN